MKGSTSAPENEAVVPNLEHPPHVHRLLRLIREGTSSHASRASTLLGRYAALCITGAASSSITAENECSDDGDNDSSIIISPSLLIWDLIGRLVGGDGAATNDKQRKKKKKNTHYQSGLFDSNWSTRSNCAMALEAVAKCLPSEDRRHFFEGNVWEDDDNNDTSHLWLSVNDLHRVLPHEQANVELSTSTRDVQKIKPAPTTDQSSESDTAEKSSPLKNQLDIVVQKGRLLLSSSGEQYNWNCYDEVNEYIRENEALQSLDATVGDDDATVTILDSGKEKQSHNEKNHHQLKQSFLQKRVTLQRQILSRRLGLGGILSAPIMTGNDADESLSSSQPDQKPSKRRRIVDDIVADEDLVVPEVVSSSKVTSKSENDQQNHKTTANNGMKLSSRDSPIGIRALLVLESKRSENYPTGEGGSNHKHARHRNPQTLLGSELAYRTFDSEWTVRHGALLGTLSLLRAWRIHDSSTSSRSQQRLGKWPQDILARCVCILALDQFSDFSGSDLTTPNGASDNNTPDDIVSNAVVAPVREMAAQIIAILLEVSPLEVWNCTHELLMQLYTGNYHGIRQERGSQWEISHGVLLAWKYIIAITLFQSNEKQSRATNLDGESSAIPRPLSSRTSQNEHNERSDRYQRVFNAIISHAVKGIADGNDDNRAVSAQIIRYCMQLNAQLHSITIVTRCSSPLWIAVTKIGNVSACASDLLSLLAEVLSRDCASFLRSLQKAHSSFAFDSVLHKLSEFIDHDSAHVSVSAFHALSLIVEPIVKAAFRNGDSADDINLAICKMLNRIFKTYFTNTWTQNETGEVSRVRDLAWKKTIEALPSLATPESPAHTSFVSSTLQYFRASRDPSPQHNDTTVREASFDSYRKASCALALFYESVCSISQMVPNLQNIVAVVVAAMLQSPWVDQCEAACLLRVAISNESLNKDSCGIPSFFECDLLKSYLANPPVSIMLKEHSKASLLLDNDNFRFYCGDQFSKALGNLMQQREINDKDFSCAALVQNWETLFTEKGVSLHQLRELPKGTINQTSMRLSASIAGALTSCGCNHLPTKLSPLIRSLFTSLKNEQSYQRRRVTCRYIADLVLILSGNDSFSKAKTKLLENVCKLACEEGTGVAQSSEGATLAIEFLVENISREKMKFQDFNPLWEHLTPLQDITQVESAEEQGLAESLLLLNVVSRAITTDSPSFDDILGLSLSSAVAVVCFSSSQMLKTQALASINNFCRLNFDQTMDLLIPSILPIISDLQNDTGRKGGCELLLSVLQECGVSSARYVPQLLPVSMRLMTDTIRECAKLAASIFAILVRIAPLAASYISNHVDEKEGVSDRVINHLILGKPMPPCVLPEAVSSQLKKSGTTLRPYQVEGVSWLKFLNDVNLNGALCDDMGLGKTLQALVAVAISHADNQANINKKTLVVCPASVVGHWVNEIKRFFPGDALLAPIAYTGSAKARRASWSDCLTRYNIVVTSYSVLRTDIDLLESILFDYCILDEGHLLKNPKTATAKASRRLKARHRLILTGTPVQSNVNEVWATFDFLMPNFLGTEADFVKEFAKPIIRSQAPDACAHDIDLGLDSLKILHQQVLPFILRREKMQVMKELPPKTITDVPCQLSKEQLVIYQDTLKASGTKDALEIVEKELLEEGDSTANGTVQKLGSDVLQSLLQLRLICTHPLLYSAVASTQSKTECPSFTRLDCSGKLVALNDLLRHSYGLVESEMAAADNDDTGFLLPDGDFGEDFDMNETPPERCDGAEHCSASKCLIFAQFTQSLDIVEQYLFEPHMPSLQYLRLDGRVPTNNRQSIVERFNNDDNIKVLLLTTKVGGLGLNLTGADTVILLEPDWNPFIDIQAQDRAHRIGQTKAVNIYRLITSNTIEEKMMELQRRKKAVSDAVVNSENSTMYSMGTEKLLDIFTFRGSTSKSESADDDNLLSYLDEDTNEYACLSVDAFLGGLSRS